MSRDRSYEMKGRECVPLGENCEGSFVTLVHDHAEAPATRTKDEEMNE